MDTVDHPDAQVFVFQLNMLVPLYPPVLLEIVVELLDLDRCELVQLDVPQLGDDVVIDVVQIVVLGVLPKPGLGIDLIPHLHPAFYRVGAAAVHIQPLAVRNGLFQLLLNLRLGLPQYILDLLLPGRRVIGGRVEPLPPTSFRLRMLPSPLARFFPTYHLSFPASSQARCSSSFSKLYGGWSSSSSCWIPWARR